jgi:hypothetical protein
VTISEAVVLSGADPEVTGKRPLSKEVCLGICSSHYLRT